LGMHVAWQQNPCAICGVHGACNIAGLSDVLLGRAGGEGGWGGLEEFRHMAAGAEAHC
jgi:hypothetical protein